MDVLACDKSEQFIIFVKILIMAKFYDITEWNEKPFFNTKGTRNKCVVSNPLDDSIYFFKTSMQKEGKDYKPEFWSEIISSEVGCLLGFNVLEYNIAKHKNEIGCISKSMNTEEECLTEGVSILTGYDNTYEPESKDSYSVYTFHFIRSAIESFNLGEHIQDIIKTIIFDSIIGNSDRHQENWGFITPYKETVLTGEEANQIFSKLKDRFKQIKDFLTKNEMPKPNVHVKILKMEGKYAPIYDSGCCLAREKKEESIIQMLKNKAMLDSFINRGKSEIRWGVDGIKLNHFDLIRNIRDEFREIVDSIINNVIYLYDENKIRNIIFNIDNDLPIELKQEYGLSEARKELICLLINERVKRLKNLLL